MLIGVDHGNKQIKTVHCAPFVSGLQQSMTRPFGPSLQYSGNYYTLSNERIPYRKDKTGDDRFFILTLIAIAEELTARGVDEKELYRIQLPVGLPPAHFGAQAEKFTAYFQKKGIVEFQYRDKHYAISIDDVACYPQAYAAAATMLHTLMNEAKAVVVDIGGFTADYLLMKNGKADLSSCDSLENGVILLYNKIRSRGNAELDLLLDEGDVDAILTGKQTQYPPSVVHLVEQLRRSSSTTCSAPYGSGCWICATARWSLWAAAPSCCVGRLRRPEKWESRCSSRISMPMQPAMSICTALKLRAGDDYGGQERTRALFSAVQYR